MIIIGGPYVFGLAEEKPVEGFPPGKLTLVLRVEDFALVIAGAGPEARAYSVMEKDGRWVPGPEVELPLTEWSDGSREEIKKESHE